MNDKLINELTALKPEADENLWPKVEAKFEAKKVRRRIYLPKFNLVTTSLAGALGVLLVLVVSVSILTNNPSADNAVESTSPTMANPDSGSGGISAPSESFDESARDMSEENKGISAEDMPIAPPEINTGGDLANPDRSVIHSASIGILAKDGQVDKLAREVTNTVSQFQGYILTAQIEQSTDGGMANMQISVPANKRDQMITALSKLGVLDTITRSSTDVTSQVTDITERLAEVKAERASLLAELSSTKNKVRRAELTSELARLRQTADKIRGEQKRLKEQVSYSQVNVQITPKAVQDEKAEDDGRFGFSDSLDVAQDILSATFGVVLLVALVIAPWLLLAFGIYLLLKIIKKKRERKLLDS